VEIVGGFAGVLVTEQISSLTALFVGIFQLVAKLGDFAVGQIIEAHHAAGQFAHRQAEEAVGAERREVDLDAGAVAGRIHHDVAGIETCREAGMIVARGWLAPQRDRERRAKADHQRHHERGHLDGLAQPPAILAIADHAHDKAGKLRARRSPQPEWRVGF
jgi:hypothetical protein